MYFRHRPDCDSPLASSAGLRPIAAICIVMLLVAAAAAQESIFTGSNPNASNTDLRLWLRGDLGFTAGATTTWADQSSYGHLFSQTVVASQPTQTPGALGGQTVVSFDGGDHLSITTGPLSGYQSLFIVYQDTSTAAWVSPIGAVFNPSGGNGSSYHGQSSDGGIFNVGNTDNKTLGGLNLRNGANIGNGAATPRPDSYAIDGHIATGVLTGDILHVGSGECCGNPPTGRKITGGIAEILLFDRALSVFEANEVGNYLSSRYGIGWTDYYAAGTFLSNASGDWTTTTNWTAAANPGAGQVAVVVDGDQITYNAAASGNIGTVGLVDSGSQLTLGRSLAATGEVYVSNGTTLSAGSHALSALKLTVADGGQLTSSGPLNVATLNTAGNTTINGSGGNIGAINATGGTTTVSTPSNAITNLQVSGGTVQAAGAALATNVRVTGGALTATASTTATNMGLHGGAVSTSGAGQFNIASGGIVVVDNQQLSVTGGQLGLRGGDLANGSAARTLVLSGGNVSIGSPQPVSAGSMIADLAAANYNTGTNTWVNSATGGSSVGNFAIATTPGGGAATFGTVSGFQAVTFVDNVSRLQSAITAPASITGNNSWSLETWVFNPGIAGEETMVSWSRRGGPDGRTAQFSYGSDRAAVHWGVGPDILFGEGVAGQNVPSTGQWHHIVYTFDGATERVYIDGVLNAQESKTLDLRTGESIYLGAVLEGSGVFGAGNDFSGSLAAVRIHDDVLSAAQVERNYVVGAAFGGPSLVNLSLPETHLEISAETTLSLGVSGSVTLGDLLFTELVALNLAPGPSSVDFGDLVIDANPVEGTFELLSYDPNVLVDFSLGDVSYLSLPTGWSFTTEYTNTGYFITLDFSVAAVPEPSSLLAWGGALLVACVGLLRHRGRRANRCVK